MPPPATSVLSKLLCRELAPEMLPLRDMRFERRRCEEAHEWVAGLWVLVVSIYVTAVGVGCKH